MMSAQVWEYSKNPHTVHFQKVNFMVCQLYLNKGANLFLLKENSTGKNSLPIEPLKGVQ